MSRTPRKSQSKVKPTSVKQLPVVVTEERTELTPFDYVVLPLLYLEGGIKWGFDELKNHVNYYTK